MKQLVADYRKHFAFIQIAKMNKKIFIPNFINELMALPARFLVIAITWFGVYKTIGIENLNGFSLKNIIIYYFMFAVMIHLSSYYRQLPFIIWNEITNGELSKYVCRPISYIKYHFFYGLGYVFYSSIFCLPIIVGLALYYATNMIMLQHIVVFFVSSILGVIITFFTYMMISLITFWTESIFGYRDLILHIGAIISGSLIPLSFMPNLIQKISLFLPFRCMVYDPVSILIVSQTDKSILMVLLRQIVCIFIMYFLINNIWKLGLKKYEAQGG